MVLKNNDAATKLVGLAKHQPLLQIKLLMKKQGGKPTYLYRSYHKLSF
jgi:DNA-binding GntR family transcriptional regulator